jgi:DNA-binding YbaB/EbfC family protein
MFDKLNALMGLMGNQGKIQEQMQRFQATVTTLTAEGSAGGGMVTVKVNGKMEVQAVTISDDALRLNDRGMLEDLIAAATNTALGKVKELLAAETAKVAQGLGLPPGMLGGLPGMG